MYIYSLKDVIPALNCAMFFLFGSEYLHVPGVIKYGIKHE